MSKSWWDAPSIAEIKENAEAYALEIIENESDSKLVEMWNDYCDANRYDDDYIYPMWELDELYGEEWDKLPCEHKERYKVVFTNFFTGGFFGVQTQFDDYDDADAFGEKVCNKNKWRFGYDVVEI